MRVETLTPIFTEFTPQVLKNGEIYISIPYETAIHLCACGCGNKTVTPISPNGWTLTFNGDSISLSPSIGNFQFPCKSHYVITNNKVMWC
jgi:hypothetical protein